MKQLVNVFIPKLSQNKFLAITRSSLDKAFGNMSALPGGTVEANEDLVTTVKREMFEETGVNLSKILDQPSLTSTLTLLGQEVELFVFEGEIDSEIFNPHDSDISSVNWIDPKSFFESLKKFGYPESEFTKFEKFLTNRGFSLN